MCLVLVLLNRKKNKICIARDIQFYIGNHAKKFKNYKTRAKCRMWVNNSSFYRKNVIEIFANEGKRGVSTRSILHLGNLYFSTNRNYVY